MLKEVTFKGGVHPPEFKSATSDKSIKTLDIPSRVILHLQQHIGAPLKAAVSVDDKVTVGTVVAEPTGFVSIPLHSPISGKVVAI